MSSCIIEHFSALKDPRIDRHKRHGCRCKRGRWLGSQDFGKEKLDWLRQYIALDNGIPSHDCIAYVLSRISPRGFRDLFYELDSICRRSDR